MTDETPTLEIHISVAVTCAINPDGSLTPIYAAPDPEGSPFCTIESGTVWAPDPDPEDPAAYHWRKASWVEEDAAYAYLNTLLQRATAPRL